MKKNYFFPLIVCMVAGLTTQCNRKVHPTAHPIKLETWLTKADQSVLLKKQPAVAFSNAPAHEHVINVDDTKTYQQVDGFGYTLTGGSAELINKMEPTSKAALLKELFGQDENAIGVSYLRLSIGASDLDAKVFSYNDLPAGETDIEQTKFSIAPDKVNLIPVLKAILAINPAIKFIAAPWSPPAWMKDNGQTKGGSLRPEYYDSYAKYFVKYLQAMKAEGIHITAITPQNEPLHPGNNPSLLMLAEQQRDFIKNSLGPAFQAAGLQTKIVVYDHNLDRPDYPETILSDAAAAKYVDGSAFHLYAGDVNVMGGVYRKFPGKNLYFTEQWTGAKGTFDGDLQWHIKNVVMGTVRNWSKIALEWNLANDPTYGPHTPGGCTECKGAITINGSVFTRNVAYYIIAHASKFVPAGSTRIESSEVSGLTNLAFNRPDGKKAMIVLNENMEPFTFTLNDKNRQASVTLPAKSVITLIW